MSWRDKLSNQMMQATFRGVPFYVQDSERQTGRNTVIDLLVPAEDKANPLTALCPVCKSSNR